MEQPAQKTGMPRGCLIGLIIGGAFILLLAVFVGVCYFNKDKFIKWSVKTGITYAQGELSKNPDGIDTTKFNALAESFLKKLETAEVTDDQFAKLGPVFSGAMSDKKIDATDIYNLSDAMITLFPDLESLKIVPPDGGGVMTGDSTVSPPNDTGTVFEDSVNDSVSGD